MFRLHRIILWIQDGATLGIQDGATLGRLPSSLMMVHNTTINIPASRIQYFKQCLLSKDKPHAPEEWRDGGWVFMGD